MRSNKDTNYKAKGMLVEHTQFPSQNVSKQLWLRQASLPSFFPSLEPKKDNIINGWKTETDQKTKI